MKQNPIEYGYCHCGCGELAPIATTTNKRYGHIKGRPIRFINSHYSKRQPRGEKSHLWKGGRTISCNKLKINIPSHHRANKTGYVLRSVLVVEKALGKPLPKSAVIHHSNRKGLDDSNKNLVVCENQAYHMLLHQRMRAYEACGNANWRKCQICKKWDNPNNLYIPVGRGSVRHIECNKKRQKEYYCTRKAAQGSVYTRSKRRIIWN